MRGGRHAWQGGVCGRGRACVAGSMHGRGHAWGRGYAWHGGCDWQGVAGWYASYWNAFIVFVNANSDVDASGLFSLPDSDSGSAETCSA